MGQTLVPHSVVVQRPNWRMPGDIVGMAAESLLLWNMFSIASAGYICARLYGYLSVSATVSPSFLSEATGLSVLGGLLSLFVLRNPTRENFGPLGRRHSLVRATRDSIGRVLLLLGLLFAVMILTRIDARMPRLWMLMWAAMIMAVTVGGRVALGLWVRTLESRGSLRQRVAIFGSGASASLFVSRLKTSHGPAIDLAGLYDVDASQAAFEADCASVIALGQQRELDFVIIVMSHPAAERLQRMIMALKALDVPVALCSEIMEVTNFGTQICYFGDVPMMLLANRPIGNWSRFAKNCIDKVASGLLLLALAPLLLLVAIAIRCESPGPVFFRQRRHGHNNAEFEVLKFRTMRVASATGQEQPFRQTQRNDDRITRVGAILRAWSIDELPQLINVLRGDMSLVGPRPHACEMRTCDMLSSEIIKEYTHRHRVKPGVTGWAQVNGYRGATETPSQMRRRVEHDLYYIENWSLLLDLWIMLITPVKILFFRQNAF